MNTTTQKNTYSDFTPGQVLSAADLNKNFEYLQDQDLLTRANLIGTGIVRGLDVSFTNDSVTISKGCGITSDGFYIYIDNDLTYSFYSDEVEYGCQKNEGSGNKARVFKLFGSETVSQYKRIDQSFLIDKSVVLLYKINEYKQLCGSCKSGSDTGNEVSVDIYALLVSNAVFSERGSLFAANSYVDSLPVLDKKNPRLASLLSDHQDVIKKLSIELSGKIETAYSVISDIRNVTRQRADFEKIKIGSRLATWNDYNFLCDLTEAYEEFRQCGEKVLLDYRLSAEKFPFPCYLILGDKDKKYRHHFRPATASDDYAELNRLWERLVAMIQYFNETPPAPPAILNAEGTAVPQSVIRLTPSVYGAVPLSEKAVPYYYKKTDVAATSENQNDLHKAWTDRKNKIGYWYDWYNDSDTSASYLNYDIDQYNFIRIEGHINMSYVYTEDAIEKNRKQQIEDIVRKCSLPVAVVALSNDEKKCIFEYTESVFASFRGNANDIVSSVVNYIKKNVTGSETVVDAAKSAVGDAAKAESAATEAESAATEAIEEIKKVSQATSIGEVTGVVASVTEKIKIAIEKADIAGKATGVDGVISAANDAKSAAAAAEKIGKVPQETDITKILTALSNVQTNLGELQSNAIEAKELAVKAKAAAAAAVLILVPVISLSDYLNSKDYDKIKLNYETVFLFALNYGDNNHKKDSQIIVSFLQWLDATYTKYQQCKKFSSFNEFKDKHPGLQHKSGVPIGGTFILVHDGSKVIADFCLPYRVTQPD